MEEYSSWERLYALASSVGNLAASQLSGVNKGSVMALSLVVSALLESRATEESFYAVHSRFQGLPYDHKTLDLLVSALLDICLSAHSYDSIKADDIATSLLLVDSSSSLPPVYN